MFLYCLLMAYTYENFTTGKRGKLSNGKFTLFSLRELKIVRRVSMKGKEEAYLLDLAPLQVSEEKWCEKCHFFDKYNKIKSFYHCSRHLERVTGWVVQTIEVVLCEHAVICNAIKGEKVEDSENGTIST